MIDGVRETWNKIFAEREKMMQRFREEFGHEPKDDNGKLDRVLDNIIGVVENDGLEVYDDGFKKRVQGTGVYVAKRKPGRPLGSKNKPKPELIKPSLIGHIPSDDLILIRRS